MKDRREKLLSHILMVVAPLLMLLVLTVAWFVSSRTIRVSELSFAAQSTGPGAALYPVETLGNRVVRGDTLTYESIIWGERLADDKAEITVENMLPGQCAYYLLQGEKSFTPKLINISITDGEGKVLTTTEEQERLLLTQCLGLYLLPVGAEINLDTPITGQVSTAVSIARTRTANGTLAAAVLARPDDWVYPTTAQEAYILAVYCDSVYGQNGSASRDIHRGSLPGRLSFSLTFDTAEGG